MLWITALPLELVQHSNLRSERAGGLDATQLHRRLQRRKVVKPLAEIRERERPNGPPSGGIPTGIVS